jgi:hypothetical protein
MDEDIGPTVVSEEPVTFCVIEPLHDSFVM